MGYCVAPIVDYATTTIEYWAVGIDCCSARGNFACGDVWNPNARSAVVMIEADGVDAAFNSNMKHWRRAAAQASAEWNLAQSKTPLFVRWVTDASAASEQYWSTGIGNLLMAISVYLLV